MQAAWVAAIDGRRPVVPNALKSPARDLLERYRGLVGYNAVAELPRRLALPGKTLGSID